MAATDVMNAAPKNSAMRKSRSFDSDDSMTTSTSKKQNILNSTKRNGQQHRAKRLFVRQAPRRDQHIEKNAHQHEDLHLPAPLHQREPAPGVFQRLGFIDHRQLEMAGRIVHRNAPAFGQDQHEKRQHQQHVRRREKIRQRRHPLLLNDVGNRGAGDKRHGEKHNHEHRLGQKPDHARAARAHGAVGIGRVNRRQRGEEPAKRQHEATAQHVAHEREKERITRQHRNQQRDENRSDEHNVGREPENPRTVLRDDLVLMEQLPQIAIRLENARPALGLDHLLEPAQHPGTNGAKAITTRT